MTQDIKVEPFHAAAAKDVAPVNQAALLGAMVVGAVATVAVDIGAPRSVPWLATLCVIGRVLAMALTMMLIGRGQPSSGGGAGKCWRRPKTEPLLRVVPTQN